MWERKFEVCKIVKVFLWVGNEKPGKCYTNFWKNVILTSNLHFLIQTNELNMLDYLVDIATKSLNDIEIATSKDNQGF